MIQPVNTRHPFFDAHLNPGAAKPSALQDLERPAHGPRPESAGEEAAGLVIAERLQPQFTSINTDRSRVVDAGSAAQTAALIRDQLLQEPGNAMLAQANQLPAKVLQLLQD